MSNNGKKPFMETVNAVKLRNHLGEVLDHLEKSGAPTLISKGRKVLAVLITPEQFQKRFIDVQTEAEKQRLLEQIESLRGQKKDSLDTTPVMPRLPKILEGCG